MCHSCRYVCNVNRSTVPLCDSVVASLPLQNYKWHTKRHLLPGYISVPTDERRDPPQRRAPRPKAGSQTPKAGTQKPETGFYSNLCKNAR